MVEIEEGWEVCGEAASGREAVVQAEQLKPDVVVLDIGMPELGGVEVAKQIRQVSPDTRILVFTGHQRRSFGGVATRRPVTDFNDDSTYSLLSGIWQTVPSP